MLVGTEPLPAPPAAPKDGEPLTPQQVMQSILVRVPPATLTLPNAGGQTAAVVNAWDAMTGVRGVQVGRELREGKDVYSFGVMNHQWNEAAHQWGFVSDLDVPLRLGALQYAIPPFAYPQASNTT